MPSDPLRVLLIEDDADDAALIRHFLSESHQGEAQPAFELAHADRLGGGCQLLERDGCDVILLDLMLPGGVGVEAVSRLRELEPAVPIVVLTGLRDAELAVRAVSLGAQDYLVKGTIDGRVLKRSLLYAVERGRLVARLEGLLAADLDGKVVLSGDGSVVYANPAAKAMLKGTGCETPSGRRLPFPVPEEGCLDEKLEGRVVETRAAPLEWDGAPARLVTLRDVTDLRGMERLREEVRERMLAVDLKNEFMTTVSHELRNPLTTVKTAIQSMRDELVGPLTPQQRRFMDLAHRNVERQIRIINNVLDLARFQSGRARLELKRLDLLSAVEDALEGYGMGKGGPRVEAEGAGTLPQVTADADLVTQVVTNLVDNALRYARDRVLVRVAQGPEGGVQLTVADDGPGMPESQSSRLFSRFVQDTRHAGSPGGYRGTGLGLAICKEILTSHGGRIWVESSPGKGARFHTLWPATAGAELDVRPAAWSRRGDNDLTRDQ